MYMATLTYLKIIECLEFDSNDKNYSPKIFNSSYGPG